jgi:hypothetical protein
MAVLLQMKIMVHKGVQQHTHNTRQVTLTCLSSLSNDKLDGAEMGLELPLPTVLHRILVILEGGASVIYIFIYLFTRSVKCLT